MAVAAGLIVLAVVAFLPSDPEVSSTPTPTVEPPPPSLAVSLDQWFENPEETKDASGNPIRHGKDPATGLPWEVRERQTGMHFVLVPPGRFAMGGTEPGGGTNEIKRPFYLGKYEVTIGEFAVFADKQGFQTGQEQDGNAMYYPFTGGWSANRKYNWRQLPWQHTSRHPVCLIRPADATAFLDWINDSTTGGFDVPSEVEWEFAARGGDGAPFSWNPRAPDTDRLCNLQDTTFFKVTKRRPLANIHAFGKGRNDGHGFTAPVGSYRPNPLGLYDVIGNVREFCRMPGRRWGYRGSAFHSDGTVKHALLSNHMRDKPDSSFILGLRLVWRLPEPTATAK